jgi:hypothetical protein
MARITHENFRRQLGEGLANQANSELWITRPRRCLIDACRLPLHLSTADKQWMSQIRTVGAAVPAALERMQAARLPLQNYFGAKEATRLHRGYGVVRRRIDHLGASELTIFSNRGSPRSGSHIGLRRKLP